MKKAALIARLLLGLIYFVFGLNGFLNFIPVPPMPEKMMTFFNGMMVTGYFFPLLKGTEVICGALLLSGFFVPLALVVLMPITINILGVHLFMAPDGMPVALVVMALNAFLMWTKCEVYKPILRAK